MAQVIRNKEFFGPSSSPQTLKVSLSIDGAPAKGLLHIRLERPKSGRHVRGMRDSEPMVFKFRATKSTGLILRSLARSKQTARFSLVFDGFDAAVHVFGYVQSFSRRLSRMRARVMPIG